jgi:uncharacterized protein YkuJ
MTYSEKLKDPRWQKKRLEIFERDEWTCQSCYSQDETLHVHHLKYEKNREPWEYDNVDLITLCELCHQFEPEERKEREAELLKWLREKHYLSRDIHELCYMVYFLKQVHILEVQLSALAWASEQEYIQKYIVDEYFKYLDNHRDQLTDEWSRKRSWDILNGKK